MSRTQAPHFLVVASPVSPISAVSKQIATVLTPRRDLTDQFPGKESAETTDKSGILSTQCCHP
jgi:hypothetical protein